MTVSSPVDTAASEDETLHCYRHPDRVTYVRCGRCDRPICPKCAMQGPVGFRCKTCGKPANDALTSFTARQLVLGMATSLVTSTIGGIIGLRLGFFVILIGFFAGGLIADAVMRFTGYKRGPVMAVVLLGGIALGTLVAGVLSYNMTAVAYVHVGSFTVQYSLGNYFADNFAWGAIYAGAAMFGAWGRLRF